MQTRWERLGTLAVALTLMGGALGFGSVHAAAATPLRGPGVAVTAPVLPQFGQALAQNQASDGDGETADGPENENAGENESVGDQAVDGIDCVQEGANQGENAGC